MWLLVFTLVLILIAYLYKWSVAKYHVLTERGVPHDPPKPLLGNIKWKVLLGKESFLKMNIDSHLKFKNSKVYGWYNMRDPIFVLRDVELIKKVGIKEFDHFANHRSIISDPSESVLSKSLIALKDQKWREMRHTLTPTFTGAKMRAMYELINTCSEEGVNYISSELTNKSSDQKISDGIELEMKDYFTRFANDVIATAAFGIKVNSFVEKNNKFYTIGQTVTQFSTKALVKAILYGLIPKVMKALGIEVMDKQKIDYFTSLVFDAIKYRELHNIVRPDMIHLLMEAKRHFLQQQQEQQSDPTASESSTREHAEFNDEDLLAQCLLFFFAGFETVSTALCFATYELCMNPAVQTKLHAEIVSVEKELEGKPLDYETLTKMKYMDMVISESLRKWPPAFATDRVCGVDTDLHDENGELIVRLKENDQIFVPIIGLHHDPKNFPDPEVFNPERFADEHKDEIKPLTYLPFGIGPRNCIGNRLALMEVKSIIYHLVLHFELQPAKKTVKNMMESLPGFRMLPKSKFWIKYVRRVN